MFVLKGSVRNHTFHSPVLDNVKAKEFQRPLDINIPMRVSLLQRLPRPSLAAHPIVLWSEVLYSSP